MAIGITRINATQKLRLSEEFLEPYKKAVPPFGPLGLVTYKRTYARYREDLGRPEEWWETCKRVIEGSFNLIPNDHTATQGEMERAYHLLFNLCWTPPGRGLWICGTPVMERLGDALVNCWFKAVRPTRGSYSYPFRFLFDLSMKGGGVGFSVQNKNISQYPKIERTVNLNLVCDPNHPNFYEIFPYLNQSTNGEYYKVPDSREGWIESLGKVIESQWKGATSLTIDVSDIRPKGERIKGFGGIAAGPFPLVELLRTVNATLNARLGARMTSVDATDIMNMIGRAVVAGNVRRTAEIALGDPDDLDFIRMKENQLLKNRHRWASNNSVVFDQDDPHEFDMDWLVNRIVNNEQGEPGIFNLTNARNYGRMSDGYQEGIDGGVEGLNPCGEIDLEDEEPCNVVEVFPYICEVNGVDVREALYHATRYAKRITFASYDWPGSKEVIERNKRIGVSLSGLRDWVTYRESQGKGYVQSLRSFYDAVRKFDREYSFELGVTESIKVTTVKPSGTVSLLSGVSPGMHWHYSRYAIRRIRFQEDDPLVGIIKDCGYKVEKDVYSPNTVCAEFPFKAPTAELKGFKDCEEITAREQLEFLKTLQDHWADNSVSSTITFHKHEREELPGLIKEFAPKLKSTSVLPYAGHDYEQAPYEPIDRDRYDEIVRGVKRNFVEAVTALRENIENKLIADADCEGGACPVR